MPTSSCFGRSPVCGYCTLKYFIVLTSTVIESKTNSDETRAEQSKFMHLPVSVVLRSGELGRLLCSGDICLCLFSGFLFHLILFIYFVLFATLWGSFHLFACSSSSQTPLPDHQLFLPSSLFLLRRYFSRPFRLFPHPHYQPLGFRGWVVDYECKVCGIFWRGNYLNLFILESTNSKYIRLW